MERILVEQTTISVQSLSDLVSTGITVTVEREGTIFKFKAKPMTYTRWQELGWLVPQPQANVSGFDNRGRPIYDDKNAVFQTALQRAETERTYLRLAEFLDMELPGETVQEKAEVLKQTLEPDMFKVLESALWGVATEGVTSAKDRSRRFQRDGAFDDARVPEDELDSD